MALDEHPDGQGGTNGGGSRGVGRRSVSWRRVFGQQEWGSLLATVIVVVALVIASAVLDGPRSRPFLVTDATISYPNSGTSIPYWSVVLASLLALLATVAVGELWAGRSRYADLTDAWAAALHFAIDGISAFAVAGMMTQVTKMVVGRLRPDYLDRCQPVVPNPVTVQYGLPAADNPACTAPDSSELKDGRYSFPSGHTSTAFAFSVWTAAYLVWACSLRWPRPSAAAVRKLGLGARLRREAATAAALLYAVALLVYAWWVGVSRITDFKHHPSDVVAGALLGAMFAVLYAVRAVGRLHSVVDVVDGPPRVAADGSPIGTPQADTTLLRGRVHAAAELV